MAKVTAPKKGTRKTTTTSGKTTAKAPATTKASTKTGVAGSKRKKTATASTVRSGKIPDNPTGASHHGKEMPPQFAEEDDDGEKNHKEDA